MLGLVLRGLATRKLRSALTAIAILGISERALRYKLKAYRELDGTPVCADSLQSEHLSTNP